MNRPSKKAMHVAGIALALSCVGGVLTGCGGSDGDSDAPKATKDGFCKKYLNLYETLGKSDPKDSSAAVKSLKDWVAEMEDYGTPSDMSADAKAGLGIVMTAFKGVDADATLADIQALGGDVSPADNKKVAAFGTWTTENCPETGVPTGEPSS